MNAHFPSADAAWQLAGWTMLHFLWVGTAIAVAGASVRFACRRPAPHVRYAVSLATFVLLAAAPVGIAAWLAGQAETWAVSAEETLAFESRRDSATWGRFSETPELVGLRDLQHAGDVRKPFVDAAVGNPSPSPSLRGRGNDAPLARLIAWLPVAWLVGAPMTFAMLAAGLVGSRRLRRSGTTLADGLVAEACVRLRCVLGVGRRVGLAVCDGLAQPVLVGIVKPTILLPAAALAGWSPEELEMVLLHELAHVRRWDNLVNLGQRLVESLLFFHPAVWLVSRQVRRDREECCDAIVVAHSGQPEAYASLLVSVAASLRNIRGSSLAAASALADHALAGRVRRILKLEDEPMWVSRRMLALLTLLSLGLSTAVYRAALAEPAPIKAIEDEPQTSADDAESVPGASPAANEHATIKKVYPITDADFVNFRSWMKLIGSRKDIELLWHDDSNGLIIAAPQSVHDQISDFLEHSRKTQKIGTKLNAELQALKTQLDQTDLDLNDIDVMKELALQSGPNSAPLDRAVNELPDNDPTIKKHQEQLLALKPQIEQLMALTRNPNNAQLKRLKVQYAQIEQQMERIRAAAEKEARDRLKNLPNEALQAAIAEYNVRKEHLHNKKTNLEQHIKVVEERIADLAVDDSASVTHAVRDDENRALIDDEYDVLVDSILADPNASSETVGGSDTESSPPVDAVSESTVAGLPTRKVPAYRYNGKTLDQWRDDSRYELMIGRRIDAINAFAVFGQSAMPREATEAILDVAAQYDLAHARTVEVNQLRDAVLGSFTANNGGPIASSVWLPVLAERYASDGAKWKPLTLFLLSQLTIDDKAPSAMLENLEASGDEEIRAAAKAAREGRARPPRTQSGQQMQSDPPRNPTESQTPTGTRY